MRNNCVGMLYYGRNVKMVKLKSLWSVWISFRFPGVTVLPSLQACDLHAAIQTCFAIVNSSTSEGMPSAVLEVWLTHLPGLKLTTVLLIYYYYYYYYCYHLIFINSWSFTPSIPVITLYVIVIFYFWELFQHLIIFFKNKTFNCLSKSDYGSLATYENSGIFSLCLVRQLDLKMV